MYPHRPTTAQGSLCHWSSEDSLQSAAQSQQDPRDKQLRYDTQTACSGDIRTATVHAQDHTNAEARTVLITFGLESKPKKVTVVVTEEKFLYCFRYFINRTIRFIQVGISAEDSVA